MSIEQVLFGEHPSGKWPLRAWWNDQTVGYQIVTVIEAHRDEEDSLFVFKIRLACRAKYELPRTLEAHRDIQILHPTGVMGQRVCPDCRIDIDAHKATPIEHRIYGYFCGTCDCTGYVPDPIYQGDVCSVEMDRELLVGITRLDEDGCWVLRTGENQATDYVLSLFSDPITILGSLFEFNKMTKPDEVSDEQWAWLAEQHGRLEAGK